VVPADAYRALVKIVLSVVDEDQLPHLSRTLEWLREGKHGDRALPTVAAAVIELRRSNTAISVWAPLRTWTGKWSSLTATSTRFGGQDA
jgi:hypothetical protein